MLFEVEDISAWLWRVVSDEVLSCVDGPGDRGGSVCLNGTVRGNRSTRPLPPYPTSVWAQGQCFLAYSQDREQEADRPSASGSYQLYLI